MCFGKCVCCQLFAGMGAIFYFHIMKSVLTCFFILLVNCAGAQKFAYPNINTRAKEITGFIPAGWQLLDSATGYLNKDGLADAALILQCKDSVTIEKLDDDVVVTQPRMLLLLFKDKTTADYIVAEQSNTVILNHDQTNMDDPYQNISIANGVLQISFRLFYNMGSWYVTKADYKFRYQNGQFVLIGADYFSIHRATADFEEYSYNFLTKKRSFVKGNNAKGTKAQSWKIISLPALKNIKTFQKPFTWEVEPNVFL